MKSSLYFLVILICTSCHFDGDYQYELMYPSTLTVKNLGSSKFRVEYIYNSLDTSEGFVLEGFSLNPSHVKPIKISYEVFSAINDGAYEISGTCTDGESWTVRGKDIEAILVEEQGISVGIAPCL